MPTSTPKYSIIIPHHNDAERLNRLLKTIPTHRRDIEIIVIDDCSSDKQSLEKLKSAHKTIQWVSTPENMGAGAARNIGLDQAEGEHLIFADSDDEFLPGAFDVFDSHIQDGDELVYFLAEATNESNGMPSNRTESLNSLCLSYKRNPSKENLDKLIMGHAVPWAKIYLNNFIKANQVRFEQTVVSNDVAFNVLAAARAKSPRVVPRVVYRAHRRPSSLTTSPDPYAFLVRVKVRARVATAVKKLGIKEKRSALGLLATSLTYGPITTCRTLWICFWSDLSLNPFIVKDWSRSLKQWKRDRTEKKRAR